MINVTWLKDLAEQHPEYAGIVGLIAGALLVWWFYHSIRKGI